MHLNKLSSTLCAATLLLALSLPATAERIVTKSKSVVIKNVTLISPERQKPMAHANVMITDGMIIEVSKAPIKPTVNARQLDGTGKFLTPGLMDSHVHISTMPGLPPSDGENDQLRQQLQSDFVKQQPRSYLYFGVTQLLDPSQSNTSITSFNNNRQKPDLFHCGSVPILGGYPTLWSTDEAAVNSFEYLVFEPEVGKPVPAGVDSRRHTPEAVVARMATQGAICVKVFIEDGFGKNSDWPLISNGLLQRVKTAAKKHGLKVMAHANAIDMQKIALSLGVDIMAHGMWNWNQYDEQPGLPKEIRSMLDSIIAQGMVYQPTFNVMNSLKRITLPNVLNEPLYAKVVPPQTMQWYHTEQAQWFAKIIRKGYAGLSTQRMHAIQDRVMSQGERVAKYLSDKGLPMVVASDTPASPLYTAQPGYSTFEELKQMQKAGISLKNIFDAATLNNAKAFGLDNKYGTITPGKVANLLLLTKNPLQTVEAYNAIDKVIVQGEVITRASLAAK
jgi:imidazolonepropionase-like amidohydrolase